MNPVYFLYSAPLFFLFLPLLLLIPPVASFYLPYCFFSLKSIVFYQLTLVNESNYISEQYCSLNKSYLLN